MRKLLALSVVFTALSGLLLASPVKAVDNVEMSHKVFNDTKNQTAESVTASKEDFLTYTLTVKNNTSSVVTNYNVNLDISGLLPLMDIVDFGGSTLSGQTLVFPNQYIAPFQSIQLKVRVRVKAFLPNYQYVAVTTFGNRTSVTVEARGQVAGETTTTPPVKVTPRTGGLTMAPYLLGLALAGGFGAYRRKFGKKV